MRHTTRKPILAVILLCAAGCARGGGTGGTQFLPPSGGERVEVTNDGYQDVVLYVMRDGMRYRLGHVSRMQTASFPLPRWEDRSYQVWLVADPVGGGRVFGTEPVLWHPGRSLMARVGRRFAAQTFDVVLQ
jgi:hypothetical protein